MDHPRDRVAAAGIQQRLRADDIGDHEVLRARDRAVHVGLRREVDHDVVAGDHSVEDRPVADVALDEGIAGILRNGREIRRVAGVGELVEHGHAGNLGTEVALQQAAHIVRADEARSPRDQVSHPRILRTGECPKG